MKKKVHYTYNYLLSPTHPVTIALVGIGGTGSQVLTCLARVSYALQGLGHPGLHVVAYDPDEVTETNIGRQLFSPSELGLNKAVALVTRVNRFFGTAWEARAKLYEKKDISANITISCVDNTKSRLGISEALKGERMCRDDTRPVYWIDFGNTTNTGQVVIGTIGEVTQPKAEEFSTVSKMKTITEMFDLKKVKEKDSGPSCSLAEALGKQDLFINSTLAQHGCALLWKMMTTGMVDNQGLYLNLETTKVNPIKL